MLIIYLCSIFIDTIVTVEIYFSQASGTPSWDPLTQKDFICISRLSIIMLAGNLRYLKPRLNLCVYLVSE